MFPIRRKDKEFHTKSNKIQIIGSTKGEHQTSHGQRDIVYFEDGIIGTIASTDYKQPKQIAVRQKDKNLQSSLLFNGEQITIRKLTPREYWKLQGFPDELFDKAKSAGLSDTQLYKQAGNSVMVNVIYEIGQRFKIIHNEISESEKKWN